MCGKLWRVVLFCWCVPGLAQEVELERDITTSGAIVLSNPKGGTETNPFEVSITNLTATWYVLRTDSLSSINDADTPVVFVLGPYQNKKFPATLYPGEFIGWHALSSLGLDEIPFGENADVATAALGLFTIDVMARLIFNIELPHAYPFKKGDVLQLLQGVFNASGDDALALISVISDEYESGSPDEEAILNAVTKFILLVKEDWINGQLGSLIEELFNNQIASKGVEKLGGIRGPLSISTYSVRAVSVWQLVESTLESPRDDYVELRASLPTVSPQSPLTIPDGYVVQGGLIWTPVYTPTTWSEARDFCTGTTFAERTNWRLPTRTELTAMADTGRLNAGSNVWSATENPAQAQSHYVVYLDPSRLFNGDVSTQGSLDGAYVTCVNAGNPVAPANVQATAGDGQATITWDAVPDSTSYILYRATDPDVTPRNYDSLPGGVRVRGVSSPYIQTGLANNTTYYFVVTAESAAGESIESDSVQVTPLFSSVPEGYVTQGGLLWMPATLETDWNAADEFCKDTDVNGQTGWRLPTQDELRTFRDSYSPIGGFRNEHWKTFTVWTATAPPSTTNSHYFFDIRSGGGFGALNSNIFGVTCVR